MDPYVRDPDVTYYFSETTAVWKARDQVVATGTPRYIHRWRQWSGFPCWSVDTEKREGFERATCIGVDLRAKGV